MAIEIKFENIKLVNLYSVNNTFVVANDLNDAITIYKAKYPDTIIRETKYYTNNVLSC